MKINIARIRHLHRNLAPIMLLPILLTLITGSIYQILDLGGKGDDFNWLLDLHKGEFGILNLEKIYPFLNAAGLLFLALTGGYMWWKVVRIHKRQKEHHDG